MSQKNENWLNYQQNEEDEEHVREEEDGSQDSVGRLDLVEVEIAENCPQEGENGVGERAEVFHLEIGCYVLVGNICARK